jgi:hypothetical protein
MSKKVQATTAFALLGVGMCQNPLLQDLAGEDLRGLAGGSSSLGGDPEGACGAREGGNKEFEVRLR